MKKLSVVVAVAIMVIAMAGSVVAGSLTETVAVTGSVSQKCTVGANGVMAFTIDTSTTPGPILATVTTDATVFCATNTPFKVTAVSTNKGGSAASCATATPVTGTLMSVGGSTIEYAFTCDGGGGIGKGFGSGMSVPLGITGSIPLANYQNAVAASYTDTMTLTIAY